MYIKQKRNVLNRHWTVHHYSYLIHHCYVFDHFKFQTLQTTLKIWAQQNYHSAITVWSNSREDILPPCHIFSHHSSSQTKPWNLVPIAPTQANCFANICQKQPIARGCFNMNANCQQQRQSHSLQKCLKCPRTISHFPATTAIAQWLQKTTRNHMMLSQILHISRTRQVTINPLQCQRSLPMASPLISIVKPTWPNC